MDRKLISYLPPYLREYREIIVLMQLEQIIAEKVWDDLDRIWKNQYLETLDDYGCTRWEKILRYKPKDSYTLEERRNLIHTKMLKKKLDLETVLDSLCGKRVGDDNWDENLSGYSVSVKGNHMNVNIAIGNQNILKAVKDMLEKIKPAGMVMEVTVMYNTYDMLAGNTHNELKQYTYQQLREDYRVRKGAK